MPSEEDSVEQRCARIRGRMQWILSQLEPADGSPLPLKAPARDSGAELEAQRRTLNAQRDVELERLRAAHATELAGVRAELIAIREDARGSTDIAALRSELAAERKARAAAQAAHEEARTRDMREASSREEQQEAQMRKEATALRERLAICERALQLSRSALAEALPHLPPSRGLTRPVDAAIAAADAVLGAESGQQDGAAMGAGTTRATAVAETADAPPPVPLRPKGRDSSPLALPTRVNGDSSTARALAPSPLGGARARQVWSVTPDGRSTIAAAQLPPPPPLARPRMHAVHYAYTHPGGSKPLDSKNQDTYFVLEIDEHNMAWAVFDGHGGDNGTQVARVASLCVRDFLAAHWVRLRSDPEAAFKDAFEKAQGFIRADLLASQPGLVDRDGVLYGTYIEEDGSEVEEAADGGTTATVICLVDGSTLVHAQVGDSSALLGGTVPGETGPETTFEELIREHSATHEGEYARVLGTPNGSQIQFVYDVADLIDKGKGPPIFKRDFANGGYCLDQNSLRIAEAHGTPAKNARGDLPAILLTPSAADAEPQSLAMTRSLGDFYLQKFGVSWVPEVISVDLHEVGEDLRNLTLILASDGVWDLWEYEPAFDAIVQPEAPDAPLSGVAEARASKFFRESLAKGAQIFGETADNMTGIVVYLLQTSQGGEATVAKSDGHFTV